MSAQPTPSTLRAAPGAVVSFDETTPLPAIIDHAAHVLANARSAAVVLEARDLAGLAYDAAKRAARIGKAKGAHDDLIGASYRLQADALMIEANAKRRLADEYDAAQERGEVANSGDTLKRGPGVPEQNAGKATAADLGLSRKDIHEARIIRDAERADPGIVSRTVSEAIGAGEEPTRAKVRRAAQQAASGERSTRQMPKPRGETHRINADIWRRLRDALDLLCGLPRPDEVAQIARYHDKRTKGAAVERKLIPATEWLKEFSDAWNNPGE